MGSSEGTKARAGLLLGAELGSSVAQGGAELSARAQMSDSGSPLSSLRFTLLLPWKSCGFSPLLPSGALAVEILTVELGDCSREGPRLSAALVWMETLRNV